MDKSKPQVCLAVWCSGFFGLAAVVHLIRFVSKLPVVIGGVEIPMGASVVIALVSAALSAGLLVVACQKPCCPKEKE